MYKNNTCTFQAFNDERFGKVVVMTQIGSGEIVRVGAIKLVELITGKLENIKGDYKSCINTLQYDHKLTYSSNCHLRTGGNEINTYLTKRADVELLSYIIDSLQLSQTSNSSHIIDDNDCDMQPSLLVNHTEDEHEGLPWE